MSEAEAKEKDVVTKDNGKNMKLPERTKIGLLLFAVLLIGGALFGLFFWMFFKLQWWNLLVIVVFALWMAFSGWLCEHSKGKAMKVISSAVSVPLAIVFFLISFVQPFITIVGTYFFVAMFGFGVPALLLYGLNHALNLGLLPESIGFIAIAVGSILCSNSYGLTKMIVRWSPLRNNGEHRYEGFREKLAYYLIQPNNVVFLLYLVYFVLLAITGFMHIQYGKSLITEGYDAAILKAFLVFIAFTNMKTKAQNSDLDTQELLKQTLGLFVHDDEDWLKQRFKSQKEL